MEKRLLVADDDEAFHGIIKRAFQGTEWQVVAALDGEAALEKISAQVPDVILLDLNMPRLDGRKLLAMLRRNQRTALIPVIIISGEDDPEEKAAEFDMGADDYICKPFDTAELAARIEGAARRARRMLAANPLTLLPGGPAIEDEAAARIRSGCPLGFFYIDIDNFKAYNDNYGYLNGDRAIKLVAQVLTEVQSGTGGGETFVGHVGGDDFVLMCDPAMAETVAAAIASRFDALAPGLYSWEDAEAGFITARDRSGIITKFPLMSLTIAIATNEGRTLEHYARLVDIAGEIKKYLKGRPDRAGSAFLKDRRRD